MCCTLAVTLMVAGTHRLSEHRAMLGAELIHVVNETALGLVARAVLQRAGTIP